MSAHDPQPERVHAAEYVLGTLDEAGRADIEAALLRGDQDTVSAVRYWEQRLNHLALALPPVAPPASVWARIALATGDSQSQHRFSEGVDFWRGLAIAASIAAVALAGMVLWEDGSDDQAPATFASVIRDETVGAGWLITAAPAANALEVTSLQAFEEPANKSLHLWLLPANGEPISLGLMPKQGHKQISLSDAAIGKLADTAEFVVSLEPPGGSPQPVPTGRIMWVVQVTGSGAGG